MPARHKVKSRLAARKTRKPKSGVSKLFFVLPILGIAGIIVFFLLVAGSIGKLSRVSLVTPDDSGNVVYTLFDFNAGRLTAVMVPSDTQLSVARNLGTWKIGSVWKLGQDEKIGGTLLAETVTKSLTLPTYYWGDASYAGLGSGNLSEILKSVFSFKPTNLTLADRVRVGLFSFQVKPGDRENIDLSKSKFLVRAKLQDGGLGYKLSGSDLPFDIRAAVADSAISKEMSTILLENSTGKGYINSEVSSIIGNLGAKISSISKLDINRDIDCVVYGDRGLATLISIAKTFSCRMEPRLSGYNFDVVMRVGEGFGRRF